MAIYKLARYAVRADAQEPAERVMHEYASYVRRELAGYSWTVFRDPAEPTQFTVMTRADSPEVEARAEAAAGTQSFASALRVHLTTPMTSHDCQLVTSSDLAPRPRSPDRRRR